MCHTRQMACPGRGRSGRPPSSASPNPLFHNNLRSRPVPAMKLQTIETRTLPNGLTLIMEPMEDVQSAAVSFLGAGRQRLRSARAKWLGFGALRSDPPRRRAIATASSSRPPSTTWACSTARAWASSISLSPAATLAENLPQALPLYADMILRPWLPEDQFEASRAGVEQSLMAIEDEPRQKIMLELRRRAFDSPWGLPSEGSLTDLRALSPESIAACITSPASVPTRRFSASPATSISTKSSTWSSELFGNWKPQAGSRPLRPRPAGAKRDHISLDSAQTQIGIAYDTRPLSRSRLLRGVGGGERAFRRDELAALHRGPRTARAVLLGARQPRAACATRPASCAMPAPRPTGLRKRSTSRSANSSGSAKGIAEDELVRCKARAKSSLVMQQESTFARSSSIARDWYHSNRVTTLGGSPRQNRRPLSRGRARLRRTASRRGFHHSDDRAARRLEEPREVP